MTTKLNSPMFKCGHHSGFPLCCILFYMYVWSPSYVMNYWDDPKHKYSFTNMYSFIKDKVVAWRKPTYTFTNAYDGVLIENEIGFGRMPCPFCLFFSNKTVVQPCNCEDNCS
jgi:hypothetical protein